MQTGIYVKGREDMLKQGHARKDDGSVKSEKAIVRISRDRGRKR